MARGVGGKRKRGNAAGGRGGGGGRGKKDRDKSAFKMRKYTKNSYVIQEKVEAESENDSSSEDETTEYDQLLQVFNKNDKEEKTVSDEDDDDEDDADGVVEDLNESSDGDSDEIDLNDVEQLNPNTKDEDELETEDDNQEDEGVEEEEEEEDNEDEDEDDEDDEEVDDEEENTNLTLPQSEDDSSMKTGEDLDPFSAHFELNLSEEQSRFMKDPAWKVEQFKYPTLGKIQVQMLDMEAPSTESPLEKYQTELRSCFPEPEVDLEKLHLKQNLQLNLQDPEAQFRRTPLVSELMTIFSSYKDLCWNERTHENGEELRLAYTLHAVNHILKTRTKILNNNRKHEKLEAGDDGLRDQGLCRPKVLIVVPFRESCRRVVAIMEKLLFPKSKGNVANKKRFAEDFPDIETARKSKSDDYYETFAGDINDSFKIGLALTKKTLKLYTDFYNSDIIIASPLGLRLILGVEGERDRNYDFLNSIEVMIFDQTEIFLMQNWDHILCIMDDIHKQPQESRGVDFSRVRLWNLDGLGKFYRQSLVFSRTPCPEINSIFNRHCFNYFGKARVINPVVSGAISTVLSEIPLVFHRIEAASPKEAIEERFKYFKNLINTNYMRDEMDHVLVFFSSYVDFVKGRNWFKSADLDYAEVCEYTKDNKMAKARDDFFHNSKHFLLYTERAHFYRRFNIKGIRHLIFYQMPVNPQLFTELSNLQQEQFQNRRGGSSANMSCAVLYSKYDATRLAECVGTSKASTMINASKSKHVFTPGS